MHISHNNGEKKSPSQALQRFALATSAVGMPREAGAHWNTWTQDTEVHGWSEVLHKLESIQNKECPGASLKVLTCRNHDESVVYKFGCGYFYSHKCPWCCRVVIPKQGDQRNVTNVPQEQRAKYHAGHRAIIQVGSRPHADHLARNVGPCKSFTAAANADTTGSMLTMKSSDILQWMLRNKVQHHGHTDLQRMVHRTKKWCERQGSALVKKSRGVADCIDAGAEFEHMVENMQLPVVPSPSFTVETTYVVPNSIVDRRDPRSNAVMFTTVHSMLHLTRAMMSMEAIGMHPAAAIDHTYKVCKAELCGGASCMLCVVRNECHAI